MLDSIIFLWIRFRVDAISGFTIKEMEPAIDEAEKELIERLKKVKELIDNGDIKQAHLNINYIVDDIFMYKNNSL